MSLRDILVFTLYFFVAVFILAVLVAAGGSIVLAIGFIIHSLTGV